jgi:hypothetical protein
MTLVRGDIRDVNARRRVLAVAVTLVISATATACGNSSGSGSGSQQLGGAAAGISVEVPDSFSVLDLTSETTAVNSIAKLGLTAAAVHTLVPQAKQFMQLHAALAVDAKGTARTGQFPDDIGAYCRDSGTGLTGSGAVQMIRNQLTTQFGTLQVTDVSMANVPVGGVPGVETTYLLASSAGTLRAGQLVVAPKPQEFCFVVLTTSPSTFSEDILTTAAQTAQFT